MLKITIPARELFDEINSKFIYTKEYSMILEHSLVSISKWEAKYKKPFVSKDEKTKEEIVDYIRFMTISQNIPDEAYNYLTTDNIKEVQKYIEDPMTATWFSNTTNKRGSGGRAITSELIYYWMISLEIPFECQKWHLNRLLTLIRICNDKNQPSKKQSKKSILSQNAALNAKRRAAMHSKG